MSTDDLATLLSGGFEIAHIRFSMPENILVDIYIMFLSQYKLWRKTAKMIILFREKNFGAKFLKTERGVFNRPRMEYPQQLLDT